MNGLSADEYRKASAHMIREGRLAKNATQEQVARAIDVPLDTYQSWEQGRATPRGVYELRVCEYFGWPHRLLSRVEDAATQEKRLTEAGAPAVVPPRPD